MISLLCSTLQQTKYKKTTLSLKIWAATAKIHPNSREANPIFTEEHQEELLSNWLSVHGCNSQ